jgi:KaiC/GvpD/RAD55 family RecA-like ATPase
MSFNLNNDSQVSHEQAISEPIEDQEIRIVVTGKPGCGKTMLAIKIADVLAQAGMNVALTENEHYRSDVPTVEQANNAIAGIAKKGYKVKIFTSAKRSTS